MNRPQATTLFTSTLLLAMILCSGQAEAQGRGRCAANTAIVTGALGAAAAQFVPSRAALSTRLGISSALLAPAVAGSLAHLVFHQTARAPDDPWLRDRCRANSLMSVSALTFVFAISSLLRTPTLPSEDARRLRRRLGLVFLGLSVVLFVVGVRERVTLSSRPGETARATEPLTIGIGSPLIAF